MAASSAYGFAPVANSRPSFALNVAAAEVDSYGNNIAVKSLLEKVESEGLLSKVAESGLLSKTQEAGLTLSKIEPLLLLAETNPEVLVLIEAAGPDVLPLLPKIVDIAPGALPLLATAIGISPSVLSALSVASLAGAAGLVAVVPDDTVLEVAAQTFGAAALVGAGGAAAIGGSVLKKILD